MRPVSRLALRVLAALTLVTATAAPAFANAIGDLRDAALTTMKTRSYHVTITQDGKTIEGDVVNPDRARVVTPQGEVIMIGPDMYMQMNGAWKKFAGANAAGTSAADMVKQYSSSPDASAVDLGTKNVDGATFHVYRESNAKSSTSSLIYLDNAGRFARIDIGKIVMRFTNFGEAVSIQAPIL